MNNIIKTIINPKFGPVNYIKPNMKTDNYMRGHKLRVKQILFGQIFTYYHPEMIFNQ